MGGREEARRRGMRGRGECEDARTRGCEDARTRGCEDARLADGMPSPRRSMQARQALGPDTYVPPPFLRAPIRSAAGRAAKSRGSACSWADQGRASSWLELFDDFVKWKKPPALVGFLPSLAAWRTRACEGAGAWAEDESNDEAEAWSSRDDWERW